MPVPFGENKNEVIKSGPIGCLVAAPPNQTVVGRTRNHTTSPMSELGEGDRVDTSGPLQGLSAVSHSWTASWAEPNMMQAPSR